jgi:hypothetical protein
MREAFSSSVVPVADKIPAKECKRRLKEIFNTARSKKEYDSIKDSDNRRPSWRGWYMKIRKNSCQAAWAGRGWDRS